MKKALAIGLAAAMAVSMTAPVYASDDSESGAGIAKEDIKIGAIYIGDENEGYTAAHHILWQNIPDKVLSSVAYC